MAKRIKKKYNYWELPDWNEEEILITRHFIEREREKFAIRVDNKVFIINKPKTDEWKNIKEGMKLKITKKMYAEKNARLTINQLIV